jgi:hypothetical protein
MTARDVAAPEQALPFGARSRDSAWFSLLDSEWPARKRAFAGWLAPDNFDPDRRQKTSLSALNGSQA